ncbi:MAG: Crp/Fnr family transcriptional regulator [Sandaracinaceae bacterium]|nr:Crp/Fnr family transcriptional regulator [Sandaracinaceae bacterium]
MPIAPRSNEDLLRAISYFGVLGQAEIKALAEASELRKTGRSGHLFKEGDRAEGLFIVRTGEFKITKGEEVQGDKEEREQILYIARPGRPIVDGVRFDGGAYPAGAVAMRVSSAILIRNEVLAALGERKPALFKALIDLRAHRSDRLVALVSDLSLRTVPARLASFLWALMCQREARGEEHLRMVRDLTTETVAARLGTVREEISRALASLERAGALAVTPDLIEIIDPAKLEAIAFGREKTQRR